MEIVHVIDGNLQQTSFATLQEVCMHSPRGPYTTVPVKNVYSVVDWEIHVERLIKSLAAVHSALDGCFALYYQSIRGLEKKTGGEAAALQATMLPSILLALSVSDVRFPPSSDRVLNIVLSPGPTQQQPLQVHVAVAAWPPPNPQTPSSPASTATAVILGQPRQVPIGKDSGWVSERKPLEALRPPGTTEVLLSAEDGRVLEGLVTNFYVIMEHKEEEETGSQGQENGRNFGAAPSNVCLQTAGMGEGVVWGTMRSRVLEACAALGIAVREDAPDAAQRGTWKEAFLTNSLRGVEPLAKVVCSVDNLWGLPPWSVELPAAPGPWTARIAAQVVALMGGTDVRRVST